MSREGSPFLRHALDFTEKQGNSVRIDCIGFVASAAVFDTGTPEKRVQELLLMEAVLDYSLLRV